MMNLYACEPYGSAWGDDPFGVSIYEDHLIVWIDACEAATHSIGKSQALFYDCIEVGKFL